MRDNPNDGCQVDYGLAESLTDISNGISKELLFPKHLNQDVGMEIYSLKKMKLQSVHTMITIER